VPIVKVNSLDRVKKVLAKVHEPAVLIFAMLFWSSLAAAQVTPASRPTPTPPVRSIDGTMKGGSDDTPLTTFEEELRAKRAIRLAEKDHEENLKRAREIAQIGKELNDNLKDKPVLDRDSLKKVERLEKLTKKVRGEAGGEDEEVEIPNRPADLPATLAQIAEASESLSKDVVDTPRQVVSASVIGKANVLLELIKMVRSFVRP
jgi:hypothetical protein